MSITAISLQSDPDVDERSLSAGSAPGPRRLLIADDDAVLRYRLTRNLSAAGYDVIGQAGNALQAIAMTDALRPDLVILDIRMLTTSARRAAEIAPVVLVGALHERSDVEAALDSGAMGVVAKPFTTAGLISAMEMAAARHAEVIDLRAQLIHIGDRLESHKVVERAKGLLMTHRRMTDLQAYRWLHRTATDQRLSIAAVAAAIVNELID